MSNAYAQMSRSRVFAAYLGDIRYELTKMARTPAFAVPTIIFPAMFYLLFGILAGGGRGNAPFALQALARWSVFGAMAPGLFGFGVSLAFEREQGLLILRQALPMTPPGSTPTVSLLVSPSASISKRTIAPPRPSTWSSPPPRSTISSCWNRPRSAYSGAGRRT